MTLDAVGRLEGHGTAGAFVEHVTMSLLDVRLDRVEPSEHHQATVTSEKDQKKETTEFTSVGSPAMSSFLFISLGSENKAPVSNAT